MTTTCGLSSRASSIASSPSLRLADDRDRRIVLEHAAEAAPHQAVIVGQQDGDLSSHA